MGSNKVLGVVCLGCIGRGGRDVVDQVINIFAHQNLQDKQHIFYSIWREPTKNLLHTQNLIVYYFVRCLPNLGNCWENESSNVELYQYSSTTENFPPLVRSHVICEREVCSL